LEPHTKPIAPVPGGSFLMSTEGIE
jgi:hypothetical protein